MGHDLDLSGSRDSCHRIRLRIHDVDLLGSHYIVSYKW